MRSNQRRRVAIAALVVLLGVALMSAETTTANATASPNYIVARPFCASAAVGHLRCLSERLVRVRSAVPGARPMAALAGRPSAESGPAGGMTPADLATAYGIDPDAATTQAVTIVDAFDDPNALSDLDAFDAQYGLPAETSSSFIEYSQTGTTQLPTNTDAGWAGEESLDIQAVRAICHKCSIVVVEADSESDDDLATAENEAVALGATVITNSFGEPEGSTLTPSMVTAFDHPGVVITAATGDDGWYSWDQSNAGTPSADAPFFPASLKSVVAVGGTSLTLTDSGARADESVWNDNYQDDLLGGAFGLAFGATGGGCSTQIDAQPWQSGLANWAQTGCGTKRLAADVSALADPFTGFDVYDTYQSSGWQTVGGTSLASPLIAAMWALAGGPQGLAYPALSLYGHVQSDPAALYDVTEGGNGYCDGDTGADCEANIGQSPNTLGMGQLDCAFQPNSEQPSGTTRSCDAATGYDGPSGVGSPSGLGLFTPLDPTAVVGSPRAVATSTPAQFTATGSTDPYPGGSVIGYTWNWGDGTHGSGSAVTHAFAKPGRYQVLLTVVDNYGQRRSTTRTINVVSGSTTTNTLSNAVLKSTKNAQLKVTVTASGITGPAGTITVFDGATPIAKSTLPVAAQGVLVVTLPKLKIGKHSIHAQFGGSAYVTASTARGVTLSVTR